MAVGENLGYMFTGVWTILISLAMTKSPMFKAWFGWAGVVLGIGVLAGVLEPAGIELAGTINAIAYSVWALWLVIAGIFVLRGVPASEKVSARASAAA
jgi:hypothetical protein